MKICYLADSESIHTKRWCSHFISLDYEVHLISYKPNCNIKKVHFHYVNAGNLNVKGGNWRVLLKTKNVKYLIKHISPDILHAHYATSYGIVGALIGFHPYIITALGSDILISPNNSIIYRILLRYAFSKADWITTMARHMKIAALKIGNFNNKTVVLPFGIDTKLFNAIDRKLNPCKFVITSTRNFEDVYNIPHLLKSIALVSSIIPNIQLNLIGDGSKRFALEKLADELGIKNFTTFYGKINQKEMAKILNQTHIFVSVSLSDGNNISLNEAMACGCFPIATNIDANVQWINHRENGFLVEVNDVDKLAELINDAYKNFDTLSEKSFIINQNIIKEKADWQKNIKIVEEKYLALCNGK